MFDFIETTGEYIVIFWRELYLFLFHMPWELKVIVPLELLSSMVLKAYEIFKITIQSVENYIISSIACAPLIIIVQIFDYRNTNRYFYFSLFRKGSNALKNYRIIKTILLVLFAPFWTFLFLTKKAIQYVLVTYLLIVLIPLNVINNWYKRRYTNEIPKVV